MRVVFEVCDFVWEVFKCDKFLVGEYNKLKERKISPYEVFQKINENVYRIHHS
jgi:hypothetical protein